MVAIVLALGAALGWGSGDFLGGLKSRKLPVLSVMLLSQVTALSVLTVVVVAQGSGPPGFKTLGYAAVAGIAEMLGLLGLYRGLAVGTMSLVAPVAATAPVIPLLAGLASGEVPGTIQFAGLALAVAGLVITAWRTGERTTARLLPSFLFGLLAAGGFGTFFFTMDTASEGDIGWALLAARLSSLVVISAIVLLGTRRLAVSRNDLPALALIGVLIVAADSMFATASTLGLVSIVAVIGSLHTVVTISLARIFLNERLQRAQQIGIAISLAGVLAISAA